MSNGYDQMKCTDKEIIIKSKFKLSGTLTIPNNDRLQHPAVLIIGGSGVGNRDGNLKKLNTNIYNKLADNLTKLGYVTLRYDKRGIGKSEGDYYETGTNDLIEDAVFAVQFLKKTSEVDPGRIFILGHSEGAILAPAVYLHEKVYGLILVCGTVLPGKELLFTQPKAVSEELKQVTGVKHLLYKLLKADTKPVIHFQALIKKALATNKSTIRYLFIKFNAKWLRETYHYDIREYLKKIDCPTLIIGGEKDIQVDPNDTLKIAELIPGKSTGVIISNMNHLLREYKGKHHLLALMKEYKKSVPHNLSNDLICELGKWLGKNSAIIPN